MSETEKMLEEFEALCEKYAQEDIEVDKLREGIEETIGNYC